MGGTIVKKWGGTCGESALSQSVLSYLKGVCVCVCVTFDILVELDKALKGFIYPQRLHLGKNGDFLHRRIAYHIFIYKSRFRHANVFNLR